mgnify:CR=1 FL=1
MLFSRLQTQWRIGMNGRTGLDYNVLFSSLDRMNLSASDYDELFSDIQTLEFAALEEMNKQGDD